MNGFDHNPTKPASPCPGFEEACTLLAWDEPLPEPKQAHIRDCPRCQAAVARTRALAESAQGLAEPPPARVRSGLADEVFEATTRRAPARALRQWAWSGAAAGLAVAGLATVTWWRSHPPSGDDAPDFAEVDLELLEEMDLAENLDLLEVLDALEELDDA